MEDAFIFDTEEPNWIADDDLRVDAEDDDDLRVDTEDEGDDYLRVHAEDETDDDFRVDAEDEGDDDPGLLSEVIFCKVKLHSQLSFIIYYML